MRDWVELRETPLAPHPRVTSSSKLITETIQKPEYTPDYHWTGKMLKKDVKKKVTFKSTTFTGGKVVATVKRRSFQERTGISISDGQVKEVPPELADKIISSDWSKKVPQEYV